ncbi:MAG: hypothetical protein PUC25_01935 [Prevotellaceae bacterium]|nr:hypothetical protein [Prevotellaceae bacterium]
MKKQLLLGALLMGAVCANAQIEKIVVDGSAAGLGDEATAIAGGTVLGSSDNVTVKAAYDDSYKVVSCDYLGFNNVIVNGESFTFGKGVQGSTNPSGQKLVDAETSTPPTSGAVLQLEVKKNGYIVLVSKLSSNKEYYVWEGDATWAAPVAYSLYMDWSDAGIADHPTITYSWPAEPEYGYLDFAAANLDKYVDMTTGKARWPEKVVLGADADNVKKNGVGVIVFPVAAEAGSYLVQAAGSKISVPGVIFSENPITDLQITGADADGNPLAITFIGEGGGTGVNGIQAEKAEVEGQTYDLGGRPATKGLLIQKGKAKRFVK